MSTKKNAIPFLWPCLLPGRPREALGWPWPCAATGLPPRRPMPFLPCTQVSRGGRRRPKLLFPDTWGSGESEIKLKMELYQTLWRISDPRWSCFTEDRGKSGIQIYFFEWWSSTKQALDVVIRGWPICHSFIYVIATSFMVIYIMCHINKSTLQKPSKGSRDKPQYLRRLCRLVISVIPSYIRCWRVVQFGGVVCVCPRWKWAEAGHSTRQEWSNQAIVAYKM